MSHKWQQNGMRFNFCVKCGTKKSWVNKHHRCMSKQAHGKHLPHKICETEQISRYYSGYKMNIQKCAICEIHTTRYSSSRHIRFFWSKDTTGIAYVPYMVFEKNGKKIAKHYNPYTYADVNGKRRAVIRSEVAWWPVYCSLTEDEAMIKDIIL
jgi:phosphatidate phosphatase PAH1